MAVNYWIRTDGVKRSLTVLRPRIRRYQKFIQRTFSTQKSENIYHNSRQEFANGHSQLCHCIRCAENCISIYSIYLTTPEHLFIFIACSASNIGYRIKYNITK